MPPGLRADPPDPRGDHGPFRASRVRVRIGDPPERGGVPRVGGVPGVGERRGPAECGRLGRRRTRRDAGTLDPSIDAVSALRSVVKSFRHSSTRASSWARTARSVYHAPGQSSRRSIPVACAQKCTLLRAALAFRASHGSSSASPTSPARLANAWRPAGRARRVTTVRSPCEANQHAFRPARTVRSPDWSPTNTRVVVGTRPGRSPTPRGGTTRIR